MNIGQLILMIHSPSKKFLCLLSSLSFSFLPFLSFSKISLSSLSSLVNYLKTHSIDPCNLFIAQYPSDIMLKFKYKHQQKGQRDQEGGFSSRNSASSLTIGPERSPRTRQDGEQRSYFPPSPDSSPCLSLHSAPSPRNVYCDPLSPTFTLPPQLINHGNRFNFDALQGMVSRWGYMKKFRNFVEVEMHILNKVLEVSLPHLPGDLVAVEIAEIPEPHR